MSRIRRTTTIVAATLLSVVALGALAPSADAASSAKPNKAILRSHSVAQEHRAKDATRTLWAAVGVWLSRDARLRWRAGPRRPGGCGRGSAGRRRGTLAPAQMEPPPERSRARAVDPVIDLGGVRVSARL